MVSGRQAQNKQIFAGLIAGLFMAVVQGAQAITLSFEPIAQTKNQGETLSVAVRVADVGSEVISAFDISVSYNTAILGLSGVTFGSGLNLGNSADSLQGYLGTVGVNEVSLLLDADLLANQTDDFILFTLNFTGLGVGTTGLSLNLNGLAGTSVQDPFTGDWVAQDIAHLVTTMGTGSVTIQGTGPQPAPEPETLALLGLGLVGLRLTRRWRTC